MTEHTEADALREEAATLRINEQVANARLIAAAPDLLDALKQIVECEKRRAADLRHREAQLHAPLPPADDFVAEMDAA